MDMNLVCSSLTFAYQSENVFHDIGFSVEPGSFCAILGCNGSGKTTLLHCLSGLLKPDNGEITVKGGDLALLSYSEVAKNVALVPQELGEIFPFEVLDVVVMGRTPYLPLGHGPSKRDYALAKQALSDLGCRYLAHRNFNQISGGERRLVLLARALVQSSYVLLLDEPTNHLDFHNTYKVLSRIKGLCLGRGLSVIASLHDPNLAARFADQVVMLHEGRFLAGGSPEKVMTKQNLAALYGMDIHTVKGPQQDTYYMPALPEAVLSTKSKSLKREDMAKKVIIITGYRGSGKSSLLEKLVPRLREKGIESAGFIAKGLWENNIRSGFDLRLLSDDKVMPLARRVSQDKKINGMPFRFNEPAIEEGRKALNPESCQSSSVVVVDEIGPLELKQGGWADCLDPLLALSNVINIWVVRDSLVEEVCAKWGITPLLVAPSFQSDACDQVERTVLEYLS